MKKITVTLASLILTGSAFAYDFPNNIVYQGNEDLYDGFDDSASAPSAVQPGIGDSYGGNIFEGTGLSGLVSRLSVETTNGSNGAYASPIPNVVDGSLDW